MHLLGRAPGIQTALICINLSPCWIGGSSHSEKMFKVRGEAQWHRVRDPGADSIFTLYIFPRETGVWSLQRCTGCAIVSWKILGLSRRLSTLGRCVANEFIALIPLLLQSMPWQILYPVMPRPLDSHDSIVSSNWINWQRANRFLRLCKSHTFLLSIPQKGWLSFKDEMRLSVNKESRC